LFVAEIYPKFTPLVTVKNIDDIEKVKAEIITIISLIKFFSNIKTGAVLIN
jgi:hypothetical protein